MMKVMVSLLPLPNSRGKMVIKSDQCNSYKRNSSSKDVIIVGAGVAGSSLAHALGKDGHKVHLIERNIKEPNTIVGETLQPGGYLKLVELGLQDCVDEIDAQKVHGYAIMHKGKCVKAPYPLEKYLPFDVSGRTFHHGRFVQRLRTKAASLFNVELEQGTVTSLIEEGGTIKGVEYKTKTGQCIASHAPLTVVCDGCFSNLRTSLSNSKEYTLSNFVALNMENHGLPHENYVHFVTAGTWNIWLYAISNTEVRCLVDIPGQKLPSISNGDMARYLKINVAPQVPAEFYNGFILAVNRGRIRTMPCRSMSASPYPLPGAVLLGDALNMRHPATGGGMMCALRDVVLLRDLLRTVHNLSNTTELSRCIELFYNSRKSKAFIINTIADAFYKLSTSKEKDVFLELGLNYLSLGHLFSKGPVSLMSGMDLDPLELAFHSYALGILPISHFLLSNPSPVDVWATGRSIYDIMAILHPIIEDGVKDIYLNDIKIPANQDVPFQS